MRVERVDSQAVKDKFASLKNIKGKVSAKDIIDSETGEVLVQAGEVISEETAENIKPYIADYFYNNDEEDEE